MHEEMNLCRWVACCSRCQPCTRQRPSHCPSPIATYNRHVCFITTLCTVSSIRSYSHMVHSYTSVVYFVEILAMKRFLCGKNTMQFWVCRPELLIYEVSRRSRKEFTYIVVGKLKRFMEVPCMFLIVTYGMHDILDTPTQSANIY